MSQRIFLCVHNTIPTIRKQIVSFQTPHKIKWWCFCFQVHHRNSVRLGCESVIYRTQNYRLSLTNLTINGVIRQFYSPLSTSVEPISPPQSRFSYGGGGGYRTLVLPVLRFVSTNCDSIYTRLLFYCQV